MKTYCCEMPLQQSKRTQEISTQLKFSLDCLRMNCLQMIPFCFYILYFAAIILFVILLFLVISGFIQTVLHSCFGTIIYRRKDSLKQECVPVLRRDKNNENLGCFEALKIKLKSESSQGIFLRNSRRLKYQQSRTFGLYLLKLTGCTCTDRTVKNSCCSICLEDFNTNETIICLHCSHGYHENCIFDLARGTFNRHNTGIIYCPLCKGDTYCKYLGIYKDYPNYGSIMPVQLMQ